MRTIERILVALRSRPISSEGVPFDWIVTVMTWQPGRLLGHYLSPKNLRVMGRLFARMHIHGGEFVRPPGFSPHVFDAYLSRGENNLLVDNKKLSALSGDDVSLIHQTIRRVGDAYDSLDRSDIRVIHCDLWHDNIKLYRGVLYPFDFEDTILGFRLHDIAMAMLDLLDDTSFDEFTVLFGAFREGYEELLEWPCGDIDALMAGRILWILNYVARVEPHNLQNAMDRRRKELSNLLESGRIVPN